MEVGEFIGAESILYKVMGREKGWILAYARMTN